jgi:hypothetical protein
MIAIAKPALSHLAPASPNDSQTVDWHDQFLCLLPGIRRHARVSFRHLQGDARDEAIQDVVSHALVAFIRLVQLGRSEIVYAGPLARFAVARVRDGRSVGGSVNVQDVTSPHCQLHKCIHVQSLDVPDELVGGWQEILIEDRTATPADIAITRIDFYNWLRSLSRQQRQVAKVLATGETTQGVARRFNISSGRVSQVRRELHDAWRRFQGEIVA